MFKPVVKSNIVEYRFRRVPFGFISSPFLLEATIQYHLQQHNSETADEIRRNIYVDNVISGSDTVTGAIDYYKEAKALFNGISMNIREWYSNSKDFLESIDDADRGKDPDPKVLGLSWDSSEDVIRCRGFRRLGEQITKRSLLRSISTIYDPCGMFTPITVRGKLLVQALWKQKVGWDDEVPVTMKAECADVLLQFSKIAEVKIPRFVGYFRNANYVKPELHCFCDSSSIACAAVVYLRSFSANGSITSYLLASKSRLAPLKPISLPRLELMGVVLGVRLLSFVANEMPIQRMRSLVWSDSKCVLHWIQSKRVLSVFVENRIKEIKSHASLEFRYVPTAENPADLPTRGLSVGELDSLWWSGPGFLRLQEDSWPNTEFEKPADAASEEKLSVNLVAVALKRRSRGITAIIDADRFSSLQRLIRVSAYVRRFLRNCQLPANCRVKTPLKADELSEALEIWIKDEQDYVLPRDLCQANLPSHLKYLRLFRDETNLVRSKGRFGNSDLPQLSKLPKLLPKSSKLTDLIVKACHERILHAGVRQTLSQLRLTYWIPHGRSVVRKVLNCCRVCRRTEGGPFQVPESPDLPWYRVNQMQPFSAVGVDYLGPLLIKNHVQPSENQLSMTKVWVCLFTCATIRAVHLDVVLDSSADQFLQCLRRFIAFYGCPKIIVSDNASTFKMASGILKSIFKSNAVQDLSATQGIDWKFIPALSPWMGGFYERLVGSVKRAMRKVLGSQRLTLIQLQTTLAEIADVLNSRPLLPGDEEPGDIALTPAHFLAKSGRTGLPRQFDDEEAAFGSNQSIRRVATLSSWKKGKRLLESFWRSWRKEYLASLRERQIKSLNGRNCSPIEAKIGTVVLIREPKSRVFWKTGRISELFKGQDGKERSALVALSDGKSMIRPLKLLYPIEEASEFEDACDNNENQETSHPSHLQNFRTQRAASKRAEIAIRDQLKIDTDAEDN